MFSDVVEVGNLFPHIGEPKHVYNDDEINVREGIVSFSSVVLHADRLENDADYSINRVNSRLGILDYNREVTPSAIKVGISFRVHYLFTFT